MTIPTICVYSAGTQAGQVFLVNRDLAVAYVGDVRILRRRIFPRRASGADGTMRMNVDGAGWKVWCVNSTVGPSGDAGSASEHMRVVCMWKIVNSFAIIIGTGTAGLSSRIVELVPI